MPDTAQALEIPQDGKWTFKSDEVARKFDQHVRDTLPWYDLATGVVAHFVRAYLPEQGVLIDIGASTGNIGRAISGTLHQRQAKLIAYEPSMQMCSIYDAPGEVRCISVENAKLAEDKPDVIVAFLCFQFLPRKDRAAVIEACKSALPPGGALIVFDRMMSYGGYLGQAISRLTLLAKYEAGELGGKVSAEDVIAKELSLVGVQRPLHDCEMEGFKEVFRFSDFAGFVYERP